MLRGCLFSLLLYVALSVAYYFWLSTAFEPPTSYWASALMGFAVLCCIGALTNARNAFRDWSLLSAGKRGLPPRDGQMFAVSGTIHPIREPLIAPFSGGKCVLCEYDLSRAGQPTDSQGNARNGSDFAGFLMTPCVIRGPAGEVKLLGFPVLDGFSEHVHSSYAAARRAIDFCTTRPFEDKSGLRMVTVLAIFDDVWSDDDGLVEKNIRLGKIPLPKLFPLELEAEIDRKLLVEQGSAASGKPYDDANDDDEEDEDEVDDDELNDDLDLTDYSKPEVPRMKEKRVEIGQEVCAIGRYNELRGGLLPPRGSTTPNRLIRGSADQLERKSRSSMVSFIVGGIVGFLLVHGVAFGVMQAYLRSPEMVRFRQTEAFKAVEKGDLARLDRLVRRGMDINIRNSSGESPLLAAKEIAVVSWLIEHGADLNAVDKDGDTALMKAARNGRIDIAEKLIAAKADLNRKSTAYHRTALMYADHGGKADIAALLRQAGAEDDVVTAENGKPLPADGGSPLAVCRAYLQAIQDRDPAAIRAAYTTDSNYDFDTADWQLWQRVRPMQLDSWTGFIRGDDATLTLTGTSSSGNKVTWIYQVRRTDGKWRVVREREG